MMREQKLIAVQNVTAAIRVT